MAEVASGPVRGVASRSSALCGNDMIVAPSQLTSTEASGSMKTRNVLALVMTFALPVAVLAQGSGKPNAKSASQPAASRLVVMPASDMKWNDIRPGAPGVKVADLWGNHGNGAFGALFKLPAGFAAPLHTHTYDMKVLIIGDLHPGSGREGRIPAGTGLGTPAAWRELPPHHHVRPGLRLRVLRRKQGAVRSKPVDTGGGSAKY